jgi:hypothetical protein
MFKKILLGLAVVIAVFAVYVAMQPNTFLVARSATMAALPAAVFEQVNDFHKWEAWDPWAKLDPNAKSTFEGPASGKGAVLKWDGNDKVGKGSLTIVDSKPNELVRMRFEFERPKQDPANVEFVLKPNGDKTDVTWSMSGDHNFISKAVCLFMDMDKMVGEKYEEGLANLKKIVEAPPPAADAGKPAAVQPAASPSAVPPDPVDPFKK